METAYSSASGPTINPATTASARSRTAPGSGRRWAHCTTSAGSTRLRSSANGIVITRA
ncbi:MAG: hypothetical protein H7176_04660 [Bdellovibrionales bacterium]|nr:hypothetical protein [Massilia sp.]